MARSNIIHIKALWDHNASAWVAESDDVPGLATEAETTEQLMHKLEIMIPELLETNGLLAEYAHPDIPIHLLSERTDAPLRGKKARLGNAHVQYSIFNPIVGSGPV